MSELKTETYKIFKSDIKDKFNFEGVHKSESLEDALFGAWGCECCHGHPPKIPDVFYAQISYSNITDDRSSWVLGVRGLLEFFRDDSCQNRFLSFDSEDKKWHLLSVIVRFAGEPFEIEGSEDGDECEAEDLGDD